MECRETDNGAFSASHQDQQQPLPLVRTEAYTGPPLALSPKKPLSSRAMSSKDFSSDTNASSFIDDPNPEYFVYIWGDNSRGQKLTAEERNGPYRVEKLSRQCVSHLECGSASTWIISETGDLWAGGLNDKGQVSPTVNEPAIRHAMRIEEFEAMQVKSVGVGEDHAVVVLSSGVAFSYGRNEFGQLGHGPGTQTLNRVAPKRVVGLTVPVSQVVCGYAHTVLLSATGQVFTCGNGSDGCLGRGESDLESSPVLRPIPSLFGVPIQQISSGPEHCHALSLSGKLFSWGRNKKGCLGLGASPDVSGIVASPKCVTNLPPLKYLSTGSAHTAAIGSGGRLFLCGDNSEGQLGEDPELVTSRSTFTQLNFGAKSRLAACGDKHTALVCHTGEIVTFGRNAEGQLGHDARQRSAPEWKPAKVHFDSPELFFYTIAAGRDHTAAVAIRLPPGILRQLSQGTGMPQRTGSKVEQAFQTSLRRASSKLALLREPSDLSRPIARSGTYSKIASSCPTPLPPSFGRSDTLLSNVVTRGVRGRPNLSQFQSFLSMGGAGPSSEETASKLTSPSVPRHDSADTDDPNSLLLPAGCSVGEILGLLESVRAVKDPHDQLRVLKRRVFKVFSDPHRLNCSFLLPSRLAIIDSEGIEEINRSLETLEPALRHAIESEIYTALWKCLETAEPFAQYLADDDQIRFLAIILQTGFLGTPTAATIRLLSKLVKIVFDVPPDGRKALSVVFRQQYPADILVHRLLYNVKQFLNAVISAQGGHYQAVPAIWHGIILMHLFYNASIEWAADERSRALELKTDKSKVPLEEFALESISESVDPTHEHRLYRQYTKTSTQEKPIPPSASPVPASESTGPTPVTRDTSSDNAPSTTITPEKTATADAAEQSSGSANTTPYQKIIIVIPPGFTSEDVWNVRDLRENWTFFLAHMWLCPLRFKRNVINVEALTCQRQIGMRSLLAQTPPFFIVPVRRSNLVEDALNIILCSPPECLLKPLKIRFTGEEGVDEGGLKREFFSILVETLFDESYGMFTYNAEARTVWFNRNTIDTRREFFLIGVVLGLALYNDILLNLKFPNVVFKKLQDESVGIEDLMDVFPAEGRSFQQILDWPEDQRDAFAEAFDAMTFDVHYDFFGEMRTAELLPGGSTKQLTYGNRKEYVALYVKYLLHASVEAQFLAFHEGFSRFQTILVKSLSGRELHLLICGSPTLDFEDLKAGAKYEGYNESDAYISDFWDILFNLDEHQKKKFLQFCTGTDRVPLGGLRELGLKIQRNGGEPTERLPTAFTCFNSLLLPAYSSKEKLERLLIVAIEQSQGFGLQ